MYKFYVKGDKAYFYEKGIEIDGTVYGIKSDEDITRIKNNIARSKKVKPDEITYSDVTFDVPTDEELSRIQSLQTNSMSAMKKHVRAVLDGELTQDEINAMLMLQIAQMRAGVEVE